MGIGALSLSVVWFPMHHGGSHLALDAADPAPWMALATGVTDAQPLRSGSST